MTLDFAWKGSDRVGKVLDGGKETRRVGILLVMVVGVLAKGAGIVVDGPRGRSARLTCRLATTGVCVGGGYRGLSHRRRRRHGACECGAVRCSAVRRWVGLAEKKAVVGVQRG